MGIFDFLKNKNKLTCDPSKKTLSKESKNFGPIEKLKDKAQQSYPKAIRMIYARLERYRGYTGKDSLGEHYNTCAPYIPPKKMSMGDICKVISYLSDYVEETFNLEPAGSESVARTSAILEKFGFTKIPNHRVGNLHQVGDYFGYKRLIRNTREYPMQQLKDVVDLFTIDGDREEFIRTDLHDRYIDWYEYDTSRQEVQEIYNKLGLNIEIPEIADKTM